MSSNSISKIFLYLSYLLVLGLFFYTIDHSFFWDTVQLGSKHANFYFTSNFSSLFLPNELDSGHIPAFGMYLATLWKLFGKSLIVSHLAMLPFVIGIVWQLNKLINGYIDKRYAGIALFLILLDPTLLSQICLISPDILLVFFFLLAWNNIKTNNKLIIGISIFGLFLTSMRGMMVAFCLLLIDIYSNINYKQPTLKICLALIKRSLLYLPSLILFLSFNILHYLSKGWIGFHDESPWAESFESVDFNGFLYNIGILGWRLLDFGRIGIWLVFLILISRYLKKVFQDKNTKLLFIILSLFVLILTSNMLWAKNLLGHRYLLPIFLTFSLLTATILFSEYVGKTLKIGLSSIWAIILISGNFWVYPDKVSQGWDATLAHLPYYDLRNEAIDYLEKEAIDFNTVHSFIPNTSYIHEIDLTDDPRIFNEFMPESKIVLYSNIFNISDTAYDQLMTNYSIKKEFKKRRIFIKIMEKN